MTTEKIEQAKVLRAQGHSFRSIAETLGEPLANVYRALKEEPPSQGNGEVPAEINTASNVKRSATLASRIVETQQQLAQIEDDLTALPQERERLLAADEVDRAALAALEERETHLSKEADYLRERLPFLQRQQEEAEREEAQARLALLPEESEENRSKALALYLELLAIERQFVAKLQDLAQCYATERDLQAEERYLAVRYGLPRVRSQMPALDEPRGQFKPLRDALDSCLVRAVTGDGLPTMWDKRLREWEATGRPSFFPKPPKPQPVAPLPPQTFTVTLGPEQTGRVTVAGSEITLSHERGPAEAWTLVGLLRAARSGKLPEWARQVPPIAEFLQQHQG
jgi:hypothetical protein